MKKSALIFILLLVINLIAISNAQAQASDTSLPSDIEKITQAAEAGKKLTEEGIKSDYLKKEWGIILRENEFFRPIFLPLFAFYEKISPVTDPIFKYAIGMTPSLSWLFILTFVIWLTFLIFIFRALSIFSEGSRIVLFAITLLIMIILSMGSLDTKIALFLCMAIALFVFLLSIKINGPIALLASIAVSFALTAFISPVVLSTLLKDYKPIQMFNFPKLFAVLIINAISLLSLWWVQLIIIVLVIVGLIILDKFSLSLEGLIKKIKEKMAKKQEEMDRELLREDVETMGKLTKAISGRS